MRLPRATIFSHNASSRFGLRFAAVARGLLGAAGRLELVRVVFRIVMAMQYIVKVDNPFATSS
jgi:hypothetical protein